MRPAALLDFGDARGLFMVREQSSSHWEKLGLTSFIPGATFRCTRPQQLVRQIVFLYPEKVDRTQLGTVALHELGHTLGLGHSCIEGVGRADFRACGELTPDHVYRLATMFPTLRLSGPHGAPETRDELNLNDEVRAACLL